MTEKNSLPLSRRNYQKRNNMNKSIFLDKVKGIVLTLLEKGCRYHSSFGTC